MTNSVSALNKKCLTFAKIGNARSAKRDDTGTVNRARLRPVSRTDGSRDPNWNTQLKTETCMKKLLALGLTAFAAAALSASAADPKATYEKDWDKGHGADGKGDTKMGKKLGAKDYTDAKVQAELKEDAAVKAIKEGLKDKEGKVVMKPAEGVSDDDIKALVAH